MAQAPNRPVKSESDREGDREFTLEEKIRLQLIESGERDRLKRLLREKLEQCGWRDHIKQLCKGEHAIPCFGLGLPARADCSLHACAPPALRARHRTRPPSRPCLLPRLHRQPLVDCADYVAKHRGEEITAEEIVKAIRPEGRASVPDSVKAELLAHIKSFIVSI